jgi:hypothetical protein
MCCVATERRGVTKQVRDVGNKRRGLVSMVCCSIAKSGMYCNIAKLGV